MIWLRLAQGILCAVEICGLYYLLQVFFEKRWDNIWSNMMWILSGVFLWGLTVYHRETVVMYSRYYMILCIALSYIILKLFYKINTIKTIIVTVLYFESIYFIDVFWGYIGQAIFYEKDFVDELQFEINIDRIIVMLISRVILWIVLIFLVYYKKVTSKIFAKYQIIFAGFAILEYVGLFFCEQVFIPAFRAQGRVYIYFALFPMIIVITLIFVIFYIMNIEKRNDIQLVNSQNKMIENNYQEMILLYQKRDRVFHDMKNHLSVLTLLIADKDFIRAKDYIGKINEPILELEHKRYTGNKIVDIILNDKVEKAESCDICFNINTKELEEGIIQDVDWCAILANVLDNAIEASNLTKEGNKKIDLYINQNDCSTIIEVTNTHNGKVNVHNNKLISNKKNKLMHGIGMESVRSAVEKYNGILECCWEKDIFKINISLFN
nr:GHKL domain-containing protein [uncultured Eisenbergiella sp.]